MLHSIVATFSENLTFGCAQAANGSTVYRMEEQLLTLLNSMALLNVLRSSGVKLSNIELLAAEPASDADLPGWWDYVPPWSPYNVTQSSLSPSPPGRRLHCVHTLACNDRK